MKWFARLSLFVNRDDQPITKNKKQSSKHGNHKKCHHHHHRSKPKSSHSTTSPTEAVSSTALVAHPHNKKSKDV